MTTEGFECQAQGLEHDLVGSREHRSRHFKQVLLEGGELWGVGAAEGQAGGR